MKIRPITHPPNNGGFTLVEIMIVAAIIALLATLALPALLRSRKRSQAIIVKTDLRVIDDAVELYAADNSLKVGNNVTVGAWRSYLKTNSRLYTTNNSVFGEPYGDQKVGVLPVVPSTTWDALIDACDSSFWAPYTRSP